MRLKRSTIILTADGNKHVQEGGVCGCFLILDHEHVLVVCGCVFTMAKREQVLTSRREGGGPCWGEAREAQKGPSTFFSPPEMEKDKWRKKYEKTKLVGFFSLFQKCTIALWR